MTINLTSGTNSVWLSLREGTPAGTTSSNYKFTFVNDSSNETKVCYPTDIYASSENYKWSKFIIQLLPTEDLSQSILNMRSGSWSYEIHLGSTLLEMGKAIVTSDTSAAWTSASRPTENIVYAKR